jgi:hypothetical protein
MSRSTPQPKTTIGMDHIFRSGRYAGESVEDVLEVNSGYILWLAKNTDMDFHCSVIEKAEEDPRLVP